mmetsp:Transcript_4297/g.8341  ORF Transcript_4297/g.8341 Transcript_4297/m.8341 type:complete len:359 (-) Transcript_4297:322-1398(-)|eukprot:CAMPEP_0113313150 /NCGR_PEP_ID=MMETSP0010_2-20120614/9687_1 /TAXON_ID=216773 ORGANISM="Corethron hystrix, Strain 308" /NCGR_SAMPLE_ID=MMETSP0010_2 /ASSEMBLY_ACC=CAM_ASM_000155 /LENGTH=358 /DNA_ID=CAMNT_0000169101 /DNA_START=466 /DNA_END=1542 /DNA_ORIENTATION=- /assembly_acc=CAM_ASM_000155
MLFEDTSTSLPSPLATPVPAKRDPPKKLLSDDISPTSVIKCPAFMTDLQIPPMIPEPGSPNPFCHKYPDTSLSEDSAQHRLVIFDQDDDDDEFIVVGCHNSKVCWKNISLQSDRNAFPGFKRQQGQDVLSNTTFKRKSSEIEASIESFETFSAENNSMEYHCMGVHHVKGCFRSQDSHHQSSAPLDLSLSCPASIPKSRLNDPIAQSIKIVPVAKVKRNFVLESPDHKSKYGIEQCSQWDCIPPIGQAFHIGSSCSTVENSASSSSSLMDYSDVDRGHIDISETNGKTVVVEELITGIKHVKRTCSPSVFFNQNGEKVKRVDEGNKLGPVEWLRRVQARSEDAVEGTASNILESCIFG